MSTRLAADPALGRLADAILIPPFPGRNAPGWLLDALRDGLGGVTVYGDNITGLAQFGALTARLRGCVTEPVIAIDEEGGDVTRIAYRSGSPYPGNAALGAVDDVALTTAVYRALGTELAALGVNLDLAPSVDVNTAADNPVIGTRSFGSDTLLVARHAVAAVTGLQSAGVAACAKHFPGHGSTSADSHHAIATVDAPMNVLASRDLPPFAAAIAAGVRAVMPGHLRIPELTGDLPASLSSAAQTGLLRGELGFTGVIVSDALEMRAVSEPYGLPEAAVLAVAAGTDLLCFGRDQDQLTYRSVRSALVAAVVAGRLPGARLEEAATRVAELRAWAAAARPPPASARPQPAAPSEPGVGLAAARRAVQVSGTPPPMTDPVLVEVVPPSNIAVGTVPWGLSSWVAAGAVHRIAASTSPPAASTSPPATGPAATGPAPASPATIRPAGLASITDQALAKARGRPLIIVVRDAHRYPTARQIVRQLLRARPDAVLVEMGLPVWRPPAQAYLATYGAARTSSQAVAEILGLASPSVAPAPQPG